jgi:hypothetical protein
MQRAQLLRELVLDSRYVIDEQLVAGAVLARGALRRSVAEIAFRNDLRTPPVRSFRPTRQARSFRPCSRRFLSDPRIPTRPWHLS